jgi:hypothetical protein
MIKSLNKLIALCSLTASFALGACDDNLTMVGTTIQPPGDRITVYSDTFQMSASTVKLDSVYAKTTNCMLGEMYDPVYGTIKADFLCQFYCEDGFKFANTPYNGKIDSIDLLIRYAINSYGGVSAYGDTLAPMQVSVFPINRPLKKNFYTNDDPEKYCDNKPLGVSAYTAYDMTVSDSIRSLLTYSPSIRVKLPLELGQKFYDETVNNPSTFASQTAFNEFFPGLYVTSTFGSGSLIATYGEEIAIRISYTCAEKDSQGQDSLVSRYQWFLSSKDVIQINRYKNDRINQLLDDNPTHTYIKTPSGVCTKLVIPTTEISKKVDVQDRFINGFTLNLKYLPADEWDYAYRPPLYLLLLPEDSVTTFFENASVENYETSFISYDGTYTSSYSVNTGYSSGTRTYSFGNISSLLKEHIENSPDKDLSLLVLPVYRESSDIGSSGYSSSASYYVTTGITHLLTLSGVKIRKDEELMKIVVLSSKYENK